jgi:hypothetical protein
MLPGGWRIVSPEPGLVDGETLPVSVADATPFVLNTDAMTAPITAEVDAGRSPVARFVLYLGPGPVAFSAMISDAFGTTASVPTVDLLDNTCLAAGDEIVMDAAYNEILILNGPETATSPRGIVAFHFEDPITGCHGGIQVPTRADLLGVERVVLGGSGYQVLSYTLSPATRLPLE